MLRIFCQSETLAILDLLRATLRVGSSTMMIRNLPEERPYSMYFYCMNIPIYLEREGCSGRCRYRHSAVAVARKFEQPAHGPYAFGQASITCVCSLFRAFYDRRAFSLRGVPLFDKVCGRCTSCAIFSLAPTGIDAFGRS